MRMDIKKKLGKKPMTLNKSKLIGLTKTVLSHVKKISYDEAKPLFEKHIGSVMIDQHDGVLYFNDESGPILEEAVRLIKLDPLFADISRKTISGKYIDFISRIFSEKATDDKIESEVESFLKMLRASIDQHRVLMPIEKLKLRDIDEITIGNVKFIPFNSIKTDTDQKIDAWSPEDANKIWGEVLVHAELAEAETKGQREIERAINLLRMYIPILFPKEYNRKIGLDKYDLKSRTSVVIDSKGNMHNGKTNLGPFGDYNISQKKLGGFKKKL
ncbi:MAG: hypothetical protein PHQ39_09805 [Methanothrix soehngenii]|nr:hypothetical protein [Methanothrix soehngenii]